MVLDAGTLAILQEPKKMEVAEQSDEKRGTKPSKESKGSSTEDKKAKEEY